MSRMLETKKRIMRLLGRRNMTITELSSELGLSAATVSQHMRELESAGAVERIDNQHFKKLKYYRVAEDASRDNGLFRYAMGAIGAMFIMALAFYSLGLHGGTTKLGQEGNASAQALTGGFAGNACPMLFYSTRGSIASSTGTSLHVLNSSIGPVMDYVVKPGSGATFTVLESIYGVLKEPAGSQIEARQHYASLLPVNQSSAAGISISIEPANFAVTGNETLSFTLSVSASAASSGTFWLRIDGPCGGGLEVLLTIGSGPYLGNVDVPVQAY